MPLRDAVEADRRGPGGTCPIGLLLNGETPKGSTSPPLSDLPGSAEEPDDDTLTERDYFSLLLDGDLASLKLARILRDSGYVVGVDAVRKHRNTDCSCTSALRQQT